MVDSLDRQIMAIAAAGTNVIRENAGKIIIGGGTTVAVQSTDTFKSRDARAVVAGMRNRAALPREQELYVGYINPDDPSYCLYAQRACHMTFVRNLMQLRGVPRTSTVLPPTFGTAPLERGPYGSTRHIVDV